MPLPRREWLRRAAFSSALIPLARSLSQASDAVAAIDMAEHRPLAIATWGFGQQATDRALVELAAGKSTLDAVEEGIKVVESLGDPSVGLSGRPNAAGFVQLDACIMHGPGHFGGSVSGVEGVPHVITLARRVMETTRHVMLVGREARNFAIAEGIETIPIPDHDDKSKAFWENYKSSTQNPLHAAPQQHDTVALLVLGADGTISGGCSTSGLADKLPGRVGDSPILGSGLYVDNDIGAAGGTGIGENILRYCGSFMIVELMRQGLHPTQACQEAIRRIAAKEPAGKKLEICFIALNKKGQFGAAGTTEFPHAVAYPGSSSVITAPFVRFDG